MSNIVASMLADSAKGAASKSASSASRKQFFDPPEGGATAAGIQVAMATPPATAPAGGVPGVVYPATVGTIGPDQAKWPVLFVDAHGGSYLTAHFVGFDQTGLANMRLGPPNAPVSALDIGAQHLSVAEREALGKELLAAGRNAPILLANRAVGGHAKFSVCAVDGGPANAIKIHEVRPGLVEHTGTFIMSREVFEKTLHDLNTKIETLQLDRVPRPAPGQPMGAWADDALNKSLVQGLVQLKSRGVPYEMGAKGSLDGAQAFDCSGFVAAMMHRAGQNIDASAGRPVMRPVSGTAADMVASARAHGGAVDVKQLLAHPEPGTIIGLATGEPWAKGRPLGIDHVAIVVKDTDGQAKIAEYTPSRSGGSGLRITPLAEWVNHYSAKGAGIYPATPAGMMSAGASATASASAGPVVADASAPGPVVAEQESGPRM
jgi:hypothetical protein